MTYTNFISYYRNWLEKHSEFKFQPKNRQEQTVAESCAKDIEERAK
jgi:hypothetical protein